MGAKVCPAELALCVCGARGCISAAQHAAAFVVDEPMWRRFRKSRKRHKRGR